VVLGEIALADATVDETGTPDSSEADASDAADAPEEPEASGPVVVDVSGEAGTSEQGGTTGGAFSNPCPGDQVVIGFQGFLTPPSVGLTLIGAIQAVCGSMSLEPSQGQIVTTPGANLAVYGTGQVGPWIQMCSANEIVVGFTGRSGIALDQVAFECAPWAFDVEAGVFSMGASVTLTAAGGDGGSAYTVPCPPGQLARGVEGRSGEWVDAFGLICGVPGLGDGGP
jgi:hypothetical protein